MASYKTVFFLIIVCAAVVCARQATAAQDVCRQVIEEDITYKAVKGDYLIRVAGMHGVDMDYLLRQNPQKGKYLHEGAVFRITRRTIVPDGTVSGILVNIPDRTLYLFREGRLSAHYPVGLGRPTWRTPRGAFTVTGKLKYPAWHVPKSIQAEMAEEGDEVKTYVPPGPDDPLGRYAVRLSIPGVLIHETIWPESVYQFRSHGCIRLKASDAEAFFGGVTVGDTGSIEYMPVKLAVTEDGRIYLEVHRDVYRLMGDPGGLAGQRIEDAGLSGRVDWDKVLEVVDEKYGIATDVTRQDERGSK